MELYELLNKIEIQSEYKIVYYDETKNKRIEIFNPKPYYTYNDIKYIYAENNIIYIEIEIEPY